MDRERIERQLKLAEQELAACEKQLDKDKVDAAARAKHPQWRSVDANLRAIKRRLIAVKEVEEREAAAAEHRANKENGGVATAE